MESELAVAVLGRCCGFLLFSLQWLLLDIGKL
jgi:hypothetical protein